MLKDSEASGLESRQALQRLMLEQLTWKGVRDHPNVQTQLLPFTEVSTEARGCTRPVTISCLPPNQLCKQGRCFYPYIIHDKTDS